jgi:hypothetical protein
MSRFSNLSLIFLSVDAVQLIPSDVTERLDIPAGVVQQP